MVVEAISARIIPWLDGGLSDFGRLVSITLDSADIDEWLRFDRAYVWHPYAAMPGHEPRYLVRSARGVSLELADGRQLIDGVSSWWTAILGHAHPDVVHAAREQLERMPHVMFGGLTHVPALRLARQLLALVPAPLTRVFFCDSGSVSVEVAMKMAVQFWSAQGSEGKRRFLTAPSRAP
jgi:adenosylmethionine-8-amino-7-oxononanoate aminotransferase